MISPETAENKPFNVGGKKDPKNYRKINATLIEEMRKLDRKTLYELGEYCKTPWKDLRNRLPPEGLSCIISLYQRPWLEPEKPKGIGNSPLLSRLQKIEATNAYFGVGGDLQPYRSFLFMIGLKKYQQRIETLTKTRPKTVLLDASPYDILNQLDPQDFGVKNMTDLSKSINSILDSIAKATDNEKIERRKMIFNKIASLTGVDLGIISARDLIMEEPYRLILEKLLKNWQKDAGKWRRLTPITYQSNILSLLYPPMEAAEAITLNNLFGIKVKIGDPKEKGFDKLISASEKYILGRDTYIFGYTQRAETKGGERTPYRNQDDISFYMSVGEIRSFLEQQPPEYVMRQFGDILVELGYPGDNITEETIEIVERVRRDL